MNDLDNMDNMDGRRLDKDDLLKRFGTDELIKYLEQSIDSETKKADKMDTETIAECVDWVLELKGAKILLSEAEAKKRIHAVIKKHNRPKKRLLRFCYAAAMFALLVLGAQLVSIMAFNENFFDNAIYWTKDMFVSLVGKSEQRDNMVVEAFYSREYKTLEEFEKAEGIKILTPGYIPNGAKIENVIYSYDHHAKDLDILYDDNMTSLAIKLNENLPDTKNFGDAGSFENDGIVFYVLKNGNAILWEHGDNFYSLHCGFDVDEYEKIIRNIK